MNLSEKEELELLKDGSRKAFESLYFQYSGKLYNFIIRLSHGDTWLTEELVQRTFLKIWETRSYINPEKTFISYLCTIAKNMLVNEMEHRTIQFIYDEYIRATMQDQDSSTEQNLDKKLLEEYIDGLTEQLPPRRKEIYLLSRKQGYSNKQIAEQLHITESTIETQLSKALSFMKSKLREHYDTVLFVMLVNYFN